MKILLVGEAPARVMDGKNVPAFSSKSGQRITDLIGTDVREAFDTVNILSRWPGRNQKGSNFNPRSDLVQAGVRRILVQMSREGRQEMILAGSRVCKAFGLVVDPYLTWRQVEFPAGQRSGLANPRIFTVAVMPHPSAVNRWWNHKGNVRQAKVFLLDALTRPQHDKED